MKNFRAQCFAVVALAWAASPATALAEDVHCPPNLGNVTIDGNVLIAAPCRLDGTTVIGNVHLYAGGSLIARGARIGGNIQAENSDFIDVDESEIDGSIQLDDLVGDLSRVTRSEIGGSIQLKDNRSRLELDDNDVGADIQAFSNSGGVVITDNVVDGNLQCKTNSPAPAGGNNRVSGNKEDQCSNLQPEGIVASAGPAPIGGSSVAAAGGSRGGGGSLGYFALPGLALIVSLSGRSRRSAVSSNS